MALYKQLDPTLRKGAVKMTIRPSDEQNSHERRSRSESLPFTICPAHQMASVNSPIVLYSGDIELLPVGGEMIRGNGEVRYDWLPRPRVRFTFAPAGPIDAFALCTHLGEADLRLADGRALKVRITSLSDTASGDVDDAEFGLASGIARVVFHVPNFLRFRGSVIRSPNGAVWVGRAVVEVDGWRITLDELQNASKTIKDLKGVGGFSLTHTGILERADQTEFTAEEAETILHPLYWFLSFCRGLWTGPLLPKGFDSDGTIVWEKWSSLKIERWRNVASWLNDDDATGLTETFSGFLHRYRDDVWSEPIEHAIHWYVESNMCAGAIEGSIILIQAAFELLSWTVLVEDRKIVSFDGFEKLPASDKMRLLFSSCGIPIEIPSGLAELEATAARLNWLDGPQAITELRNALIHSHPRKRKRALGDGTGPRWEAWWLGLWFLELSLLSLIGFKGGYSNRLIRSVTKGQEVRTVPWV